jgi:nicotinate-nucleotide adenylyltransferase
MKKERIGLFGGTFAPPHKGHIHAVKAMHEFLSPDKIIIMPTFIPPHKQKLSIDTPEQRLRMCKAAFGSLPYAEVSDYEITKGGLSYTAVTLEHLKTDENEICLLCGSDMFLSLENWYHSADIFAMADVAVVPRFTDDMDSLMSKKAYYEQKYTSEISIIGADPTEMSSTEIRDAVKNKLNLEKYLTKEVIEIIEKEKLYL